MRRSDQHAGRWAPGSQHLVDQPGEFDSRLRALPGYDRIEPYRPQILTKAGELVGSTSAFLFAALSATTRATAVFIFPRLVGQDTKMHELLIFFSTLGGLMFFGAMGFIRSDSGRALRHGVGNVRHDVPHRAC